jgi:hypothetical protein
MQDKADAAFSVLCEILEDPQVPANVRLGAAKDILDRNAGSQQQQAGLRHEKFEPEQLQRAALAAEQMDNVIKKPTVQ